MSGTNLWIINCHYTEIRAIDFCRGFDMQQPDGKNLVDGYISTFPAAVQELLQQVRHVISEEAPLATEKISYGMPTFFLRKNLVHFAAAKHHIGFYPTPSAIEAFRTELAPYHHSKGAIRFPMEEPLPIDLIRRMVRFRVEENLRH